MPTATGLHGERRGASGSVGRTYHVSFRCYTRINIEAEPLAHIQATLWLLETPTETASSSM